MRIPEKPAEKLAFLRDRLLNDVVPFWERHGPDPATGAIRTCIADDGASLSDDRYMWSQLRAVWTFSALYNRIEPRERWLDVARRLVAFCTRHGRDETGAWRYRVSPEGRALDGPLSIYTDGFAMYGLAEYFRAAGDQSAARVAVETLENVQKRLAVPGSYGIAPYSIPEGAQAHGISMIFSLVFHDLGVALGREDAREAGLVHARRVMDTFLRKDSGLILEYVGLDGAELPDPIGKVVLPGHAIESMWFMIHIFRRYGDRDRIRRALESIRRHLEFGWDPQYGGIFLARAAEGGEPAWPHWEKKLWWPHTEALLALILAREFSDADWIDEWYRRVHEYSFSRFPDPVHGEWTQRLDREGRKIHEVIALPVKDPFHLPRALILAIESLERQL